MNPSITQDAVFDPNKVLLGSEGVFARSVTILSGQTLAAGALLGAIALAAATPAAGGGNTGDGTIGAVTVGEDAKVGAYTLTITAADTNAGDFELVDPDGEMLDGGTVGAAYANDHLGFTLADGATDFAVGDTFTITVAAGSGKYVLSLAAADDGSKTPIAIAAEAIDASAGDKSGIVYFAGNFNERKITFGTGHTADSVRVDLAARGIFLHSSVA